MASIHTQSKEVQEKHKRLMNELMKQPGNTECMDCRSRNPTWASTNLGIFVCIRCSGLHRQVGVHITKVKSCTMDLWDPEQIAFMRKMGNLRAKERWEAKLPPDFGKPSETESSDLVLQWIRTKYEHKKYEGTPAARPAQSQLLATPIERKSTLNRSTPSSPRAGSPINATAPVTGGESNSVPSSFSFINPAEVEGGAPAFSFINSGSDHPPPSASSFQFVNSTSANWGSVNNDRGSTLDDLFDTPPAVCSPTMGGSAFSFHSNDKPTSPTTPMTAIDMWVSPSVSPAPQHTFQPVAQLQQGVENFIMQQQGLNANPQQIPSAIHSLSASPAPQYSVESMNGFYQQQQLFKEQQSPLAQPASAVGGSAFSFIN